MQLVDEIYCLLSALTHLLTAFIMSTNYISSNIDKSKLYSKVSDFKQLFSNNFDQAKSFFRKCFTTLGNSPHKDFIPTLDHKVLDHIQSVPCMQDLKNEFNLFEFLHYKKSIAGIKIPFSYGATIHNIIPMSEMEPKKPTHSHRLML